MPNVPVFDAALVALREVRYAAVPGFIVPQRRVTKRGKDQAS